MLCNGGQFWCRYVSTAPARRRAAQTCCYFVNLTLDGENLNRLFVAMSVVIVVHFWGWYCVAHTNWILMHVDGCLVAGGMLPGGWCLVADVGVARPQQKTETASSIDSGLCPRRSCLCTVQCPLSLDMFKTLSQHYIIWLRYYFISTRLPSYSCDAGGYQTLRHV